MEWIRGMVDDGLLKTIPSSAAGVDEYLAINNKTSSMLIQTSTAITTVNALLSGSVSADQAAEQGVDVDSISQGLDIGVGPVPGVEAPGKGQIGGSGWYLVDQPDPASIAAGWDFLKWFLQTPQQVTWTLQASYLPVLESAADDPTLQQEFTTTTKGEWLNVAYQSLSNLDPDFPGPVIGPYKEFRADVRAAMDDVALNGADPAEAVTTASEKFQTALDDYRQDVQG
jgi:sn-glycerol 3-phosphate transport system substrate-binding protein